MSPAHSVEPDERDGFEGIALVGPDLRAAFAPGVGMIGYSLEHRGDELLGQRGGLRRYAETGSSFGIPLLHPWANRLDGLAYEAGGRRVELDPGAVRLDPNGLPIHGLLTASPHWEVTSTDAGEDAARLVAGLDFGAHEGLLAGFPFPHELEIAVEVSGPRLTVATTIRPTADVPVPVAFGWHPYLRLPGVARDEWVVDLSPLERRALLDDRGIPTGAGEPAAQRRAPLGDRAYDDLFDAVREPARFTLEGGGREIAIEFDSAYPVAQVYAPPGEDFVCIEPMTAPTNALSSGDGLRVVEPGETLQAAFSITVAA